MKFAARISKKLRLGSKTLEAYNRPKGQKKKYRRFASIIYSPHFTKNHLSNKFSRNNQYAWL